MRRKKHVSRVRIVASAEFHHGRNPRPNHRTYWVASGKNRAQWIFCEPLGLAFMTSALISSPSIICDGTRTDHELGYGRWVWTRGVKRTMAAEGGQ